MFHSWPNKMDDLTGSRRSMDHVRDPSTIRVSFRQVSPGLSFSFFAPDVLQRSGGQVQVEVPRHLWLSDMWVLSVFGAVCDKFNTQPVQLERSLGLIHPLPLNLPRLTIPFPLLTTTLY